MHYDEIKSLVKNGEGLSFWNWFVSFCTQTILEISTRENDSDPLWMES